MAYAHIQDLITSIWQKEGEPSTLTLEALKL